MKPNEIASKADWRITRIKFVSRLFRVLISIAVIFLMLIACFVLVQSIILCLGGRVVPAESMAIHITLAPGEVYDLATGVAGLPWMVVVLIAVRLGLIAFGFIALNRLFKLYERGVFFAKGNISCLKIQGWVMAGCGLIQNTLQLFWAHKNISLDRLVIGLLILLIAWVMDEGRKLQEEQELTI